MPEVVGEETVQDRTQPEVRPSPAFTESCKHISTQYHVNTFTRFSQTVTELIYPIHITNEKVCEDGCIVCLIDYISSTRNGCVCLPLRG